MLAFTVFHACKQRNASYLYQRLGIHKPVSLPHPVWCHCASVGEIKTALPLLQGLSNHGEPLLISTNTITGLQVLQNAQLQNATAVFLPWDYSLFANKFLSVYSPKICLLFETELWPSILLTTIRRSIPVVIINGRITQKTLQAPDFIKTNYSHILKNIHLIIASSTENAQRFSILGANQLTIKVLDNLKFAQIVKHSHNPLKRKYVLCASTHANEEELLLRGWNKHSWDNINLVIAMRHPQRKHEVCKILQQQKLDYTLHSQLPAKPAANAVYLVDTVGELMPFIEHAMLVFIGGSLVPIGGHNILEPAQFGKCILIGPHHEDFSEIVNDLQQHQAILVEKNAQELMDKIHQLVNDEESRTTIGQNAQRYVQAKAEVLDQYTNAVIKLVESHS